MSGKSPPPSQLTNLVSSISARPRRRDSVVSVSTASNKLDKEQLAQTLDKIHTSASQRHILTTFNDLAPPPESATSQEQKGFAGDLVQHGFSGLYSRFKEAVGVGAGGAIAREKASGQERDEADSLEAASKKSNNTINTAPTASIGRVDTGHTTSSMNSVLPDSPASLVSSPSAAPTGEGSSQQAPATSVASMTGLTPSAAAKPTSSGRQSIPNMTKPTAALAAITVSAFKDAARSVSGQEASGRMSGGPRSAGRTNEASTPVSEFSSLYDISDSRGTSALEKMVAPSRSRRDEAASIDGKQETPLSPATGPRSSPVSPTLLPVAQDHGSLSPRSRFSGKSAKRPAVIDRISRSDTPGALSRSSSLSQASQISTAAHHNVRHESFGREEQPQRMRSGGYKIPGTTTDEGAPETVNATLESMRRQVLSKDYWMADAACKECFLCGTPFSAFRRKHHCRTCGCIFDSRCTSIISGQKFGVQGTLRVCKECLKIISQRQDGHVSDDSADDSFLPAIFRPNKLTSGLNAGQVATGITPQRVEEGEDYSRSMSTPMMAIPATRRMGDASNRNSAVLEIDMPHLTQLSRPSSSRSLRSLAGRPQSAGHRRQQSKHTPGFLHRFKSSPVTEDPAPFRRSANEEAAKKAERNLPAFHDDNVIDPDLAPFMSDQSSGDEQMSIFQSMASHEPVPAHFDGDKTNLGTYLGVGRKGRVRNQGEKSIGGLSIGNEIGSLQPRATRRRNMSTASVSVHHHRSPRPKTATLAKGPSASTDNLAYTEGGATKAPPRLTRSSSMKGDKQPRVELNATCLMHVRKLLGQLLQDANVPHASAWERALMPILLKCAASVDPDMDRGDAIDIRHYVKLKKIVGGRPGDTSYVSGVVFTKKLALKSMARHLANPRVVIVSFPIEYRRHQQHFMSLQPVIDEEKEFLKVIVSRIVNLRPQLLLAQKSVSGLALQYLAEANVAVAYNVKASVLSAVSRCLETQTISSVDQLSLPMDRFQLGRGVGFEVKTYVNEELAGRKKTYIFLSASQESLGCTIVLRGAGTAVLREIKRITEFMVYVVYNLKLESCLMRDCNVRLPAMGEMARNSDAVPEAAIMSARSSRTDERLQCLSSTTYDEATPRQEPVESGAGAAGVDSPTMEAATSQALHHANALVSLHEEHGRASHASLVPDDTPMPTYYSDMVAKYQTKILSASPCVKFSQPYLLMQAREQERRLAHFKKLRDQDMVEVGVDGEKPKAQRFQLIKPQMVHQIGHKAPRQIMEVLHAVHDAEYDKALYNYQTQTRQWENYIQGNLDLFEPYSHQSIVVLHSVVCTETKIPCGEPEMMAIAFYDEHVEDSGQLYPDCTLGQYVEDVCFGADSTCSSNSCDRKMYEHHRTYVHGEARITIFMEQEAKGKARRDNITMWSYCKICKRETAEREMSRGTWKYSFGKFLELSFWSRGTRLVATAEEDEDDGWDCGHDYHRDHIRYFGVHDKVMRVHYDPIDLLEIIVPRARITWKVEHDLDMKNDIFTHCQERWSRFTASVKARLKAIKLDKIAPDKAEACKAEIERMSRKVQDEHVAVIRKLQDTYVNSKYYEVIPFNRSLREMLERVVEWDAAFAKFETDFLPTEKDIRRQAMLQLRKMFTDESKDSLSSADINDVADKTSQATAETDPKPDAIVAAEAHPSEPGTDEKDETAAETQMTEAETLMQTQTQTQTTEAKPVTTTEAEATTMTTTTTTEKEATTMPETEAQTMEAEAMSTLDRVEPLDLALHQLPAPCPPVAEPSGQGWWDAGEEADPTSSSLLSPGTSQTASKAVTAPASPTALGPSVSLAEQVEMLRRRPQAAAMDVPVKAKAKAANGEPSGKIEPSSERTPRKLGPAVTSIPTVRTISQPGPNAATSLPRTASAMGKKLLGLVKDKDKESAQDTRKAPTTDSPKGDKTILGFRARSSAKSSIPRFVGKKRNSRVTTLTMHFEQLSREFKKERMKVQEERAAKMSNSRAVLQRSSTKAIVEVYEDPDEAVHEPGHGVEDVSLSRMPSRDFQPTESADNSSSRPGSEPADGSDGSPDAGPDGDPDGRPEDGLEGPDGGPDGESSKSVMEVDKVVDEGATADEVDDHIHNASQMATDDEQADSDTESALLEGTTLEEIADSIDSRTEIPLELPKQDKMNFMKVLTNFWAERSASEWPPLDYPLNAADHLYPDSDIIIREDEPSSLIAFALTSADYRAKESRFHGRGAADMQAGQASAGEAASAAGLRSGPCEGVSDEALEASMRWPKSKHLKYQFNPDSAKMLVKIFYAEQFDALRHKCGVADRIVESLSRCMKFDSKGGKTKAVFLKTQDDRLMMKSLSPIETSAFLKFAPAYFEIMAEALFHDLPSVIAKMLGFYQVIIKNPETNTEIKLDLLLMENLFYDRSPSRIFDLKGSMRNRKIESTGEQNEVLLDENMVEYIYESPLFAREHSKKILRVSVWNDTLFLAKQNVMDYSLMIAVDEVRKELVVGIIDCIRTYTWDKTLESWIKGRGFAGGGRNRPTVTSPKEYKSRFREAMARYILQAPNCWHQFAAPSLAARPQADAHLVGDDLMVAEFGQRE